MDIKKYIKLRLSSLTVVALIPIVFFIGSAIAPWVFWLIKSVLLNLGYSDLLEKIPFSRVLNRCLLGSLILIVLLILKFIQLDSFEKIGLKVDWTTGHKLFLKGISLGIFTFSIIGILEISLNYKTLKSTLGISDLSLIMVKGIITGIVVSILEETIFRGIIYNALKKSWGMVRGLILSSLIYSVVHFFKRPVVEGEIKWDSGFCALPGMLSGIFNYDENGIAMINLIIIGGVLVLLYEATGNLWMSIGLHGGWVFCMKFYKVFSPVANSSVHSIWFGNNIVDGLFTTILLSNLIMFIILFNKYLRKGICARSNAM